jgi:hypothetical protein
VPWTVLIRLLAGTTADGVEMIVQPNVRHLGGRLGRVPLWKIHRASAFSGAFPVDLRFAAVALAGTVTHRVGSFPRPARTLETPA